MEQLPTNLNNNKIDRLTSFLKGAVGAVPIAGSLLSEIVSNIIPNQRIDRLTRYVELLSAKLSAIPVETINILLSNEEFTDLIEESFNQAAQALTDERRVYIASFVISGINTHEISLQESKHLLRILKELNDVEILWLCFYYFKALSVKMSFDFKTKHEEVLKPLHQNINNSTSIDYYKSTLQQSYKDHLMRLNLISPIYQTNYLDKLENYKDSSSTKVSSYVISPLGKLLVKQLSIDES